jgi:hypothetical protein
MPTFTTCIVAFFKSSYVVQLLRLISFCLLISSREPLVGGLDFYWLLRAQPRLLHMSGHFIDEDSLTIFGDYSNHSPMDPLSIAASVAGLVGLSIQLIHIANGFPKAMAGIQDFLAELKGLSGPSAIGRLPENSSRPNIFCQYIGAVHIECLVHPAITKSLTDIRKAIKSDRKSCPSY